MSCYSILITHSRWSYIIFSKEDHILGCLWCTHIFLSEIIMLLIVIETLWHGEVETLSSLVELIFSFSFVLQWVFEEICNFWILVVLFWSFLILDLLGIIKCTFWILSIPTCLTRIASFYSLSTYWMSSIGRWRAFLLVKSPFSLDVIFVDMLSSVVENIFDSSNGVIVFLIFNVFAIRCPCID